MDTELLSQLGHVLEAFARVGWLAGLTSVLGL
jgi:hypothetical protein